MFEISVQHEFCAAHRLTIAGMSEPIHGHNWHVTVTLAGETLDQDGLLCDFHTVEHTLRDVTEPFNNQSLNDVPPFDTTNPSAELVAKHIADELIERLGHALAPAARIAAVRVTEAAGCAATYRPPLPRRTE